MKKYFIIITLVIFNALLLTNAYAISEKDLKEKMAQTVAENMKSRGLDVTVKVEIIKNLDAPKGYYYTKLTFYEKSNPKVVAGEQFLFSDGEFIVQDFLNISDMSSVAKRLVFETSQNNIDVSNLTYVYGNPKAKNIVVEVTDFQCPYCVKMNEYLHKKMQGRDDVVLYIMHLPLRAIHPKAEILAKIFEAGMLMKSNFLSDLYNEENGNLSDADLIEKYAKKTSDAKKFKTLLVSKEVSEKVANAEKQANALNIKSTPQVFINGKTIAGFDTNMIDIAFSELKK